MKNEDTSRPLKKEQLYSEPYFTSFCERDHLDGRKIEKHITKEFLDACEKDGLIVPLLAQKEIVRRPNELEREEDVRYYSPYQIYFVSALSENVLDKDGNLRDTSMSWEYQEEQKTRYINWGGWHAFNAEIYQRMKTEGLPDDSAGPNHFRLAEEFHQLLHLLHSFDEEKDPEKIDPNRSRYFRPQQSFQLNLDPLRTEGNKLLAQYELDVDKLKKILHHVGYYATHIDPLERWFYYLRRHPQWRKDTLKGKAALAQELYGLCDTITEIIEIVSGEKLPPFLDYIHPDFKPYLFETTGYAEGRDLKAVQAAYKRLRGWIDAHQELIVEAVPTLADSKLFKQEFAKLDRVSEELIDFERRYGDRRYTSGMRIVGPEEKLGIDDLDDAANQWVQKMMKHHENATTRDKEIDLELEVKYEIKHAIEQRLGDLVHAIMEIAGQLSNTLWVVINKVEQEKNLSQPRAWEDFNKRVDPQAPDYAVRRAQFWRKDLVEFQKPYDDRIKELKHNQAELNGIIWETRLVFCAVCREKPVRLHHSHNDGRVSNEAVCDECFAETSARTLQATEEDWKKIKYAEWKCDFCNQRTLYKFALGNTISLETKAGVSIQITLEHGRMELQARCPNPECGNINTRAVDWGWHP